MKDRRTYEIMRAEDVGAPWNPPGTSASTPDATPFRARCTALGLTVEGRRADRGVPRP